MKFTKDAECHFIVGMRGSGKSTVTKSIIKARPKVVVFDPRAEYENLPTCRTHAQVLAVIKRGWARGFKLAYVPPGGAEKEALDGLCKLLKQVQRPYQDFQDTRKLSLVVEEMNLSYPSEKLPSHLGGMADAINQGRHWGMEIFGVTQRPALVNLNFRGQAATNRLFTLEEARDIKVMSEKFGREWAPVIRDLPKYRFLLRENAQISAWATTKTGVIKRISL